MKNKYFICCVLCLVFIISLFGGCAEKTDDTPQSAVSSDSAVSAVSMSEQSPLTFDSYADFEQWIKVDDEPSSTLTASATVQLHPSYYTARQSISADDTVKLRECYYKSADSTLQLDYIDLTSAYGLNYTAADGKSINIYCPYDEASNQLAANDFAGIVNTESSDLTVSTVTHDGVQYTVVDGIVGCMVYWQVDGLTFYSVSFSDFEEEWLDYYELEKVYVE